MLENDSPSEGAVLNLFRMAILVLAIDKNSYNQALIQFSRVIFRTGCRLCKRLCKKKVVIDSKLVRFAIYNHLKE